MLANSNIIVIPAEFSCTIINEDLILPNVYSLSISIEPIHPIKENIGVGFQKVKHFLRSSLGDSIFIHKDHKLVEPLQEFQNDLVCLPSEPYDFYVGSVILAKLIAISEKYFEIEQLTIDSYIGERVQYTIYDPYSSGLDLDGDHWWNSDDASTNSSKIVSWSDLDLEPSSAFEPKIIKGGLSEK